MFEDYACVLDAARPRPTCWSPTPATSGPTPAQQHALVEFVRRGGRWLALHGTHSAIDPPGAGLAGRTAPRGCSARWPTCWAGSSSATRRSRRTRSRSPRPGTRWWPGIEPFEVRDELYVCELHPPIEVLLHARYTGPCRGFEEGDVTDDEPRPVLYLKQTGAGTVCFFTLGHCRGRFDVQDLGVDDLGRHDFGSWTVRRVPHGARALHRLGRHRRVRASSN